MKIEMVACCLYKFELALTMTEESTIYKGRNVLGRKKKTMLKQCISFSLDSSHKKPINNWMNSVRNRNHCSP